MEMVNMTFGQWPSRIKPGQNAQRRLLVREENEHGRVHILDIGQLARRVEEGVWAYRRLDAADNSIQNAPLREKVSWKAMIREAVNADPRKKATLSEIKCFVRKTFEMPATFTKECVRRKTQANVVRGFADGTFRMTQGCGL
ncbi:hypothetical protein B9Z55_027986 [Caenorhabditis nigoni]|uniref:Uncharacterized protein n=1 Tax=Caenorhabditis nigoni TaxID=1611254 RepID=A0A2G5SDF9_9PELO|nr:hypothetical protein B9Z55_027986 [Caenorhabditis nigoni]